MIIIIIVQPRPDAVRVTWQAIYAFYDTVTCTECIIMTMTLIL